MTFDQNSPDFRVFNEIIQMRQSFLGIHNWGHPRYSVYSYPQRLCLLSDMNRTYILREVGHIPKFLEIEDEINKMPGRLPSSTDICIYEQAKWVNEQHPKMKPFDSDKEKIILSLLCYGKDYVNKAINYMFKSLMTEGNLPVLCKEKQVIFHVQTDEAGKTALENAPIVAKIKSLGAHFEYCLIPDELVKQIDRESVYWLVGAAATLGIEYARTCNAAFHHSYPDIIYSDNFFAEILRLSKFHSSILAPGHRSDEAVMLPSLKPYETDDAISVPSSDLIALELNAVHMAQWPGIVNNRPGHWCYPQNHNIIWETPNTIYLNCPHLNAWWLSKDVIAKAPQRFYISLDSELDFLCEGNDFYIPQVCDSLYLIEFSNQGKQKVEDFFLDAANYAGYFWKLSTNRDNFKFFARAMQLRINRNVRPIPPNVLDDEGAMNEMVYLLNTIQSKDPGIGTTLTRPRTHLNRVWGVTKVRHD